MPPSALRVRVLLLNQPTELATVISPCSPPVSGLSLVVTVTLAESNAVAIVDTLMVDAAPVGVYGEDPLTLLFAVVIVRLVGSSNSVPVTPFAAVRSTIP